MHSGDSFAVVTLGPSAPDCSVIPFSSGIQDWCDTVKEKPVLLLEGKRNASHLAVDVICRITAGRYMKLFCSTIKGEKNK
jgi:hypothetical protein